MSLERRFLLASLPPGFKKLKGHLIQLGVLIQDASREVGVRLVDGTAFLCVQEGMGTSRRRVELPIPQTHFEALWPLTAGRRLKKTRRILREGEFEINIDVYRGDLAPLQIAVVNFPSAEKSERFRRPAFLGEEITGKLDYSSTSLAVHGVPHKSAREYRIGALPFTIRNGRVHIVLVTNTAGTRWIVPKGQPEPDMTRQDVAVMEAMEEAGVIGIFEHGLKSQCKLRDGRTLHLYPVKVSTLLKNWPESTVRRREVLPLKEAVEKITDRPLAQCVARLAARLK